MLNSDAITFDLKQFQTQKWRPNSSLNGALPLVASMKGNKSPCLSIESALGSHDGRVALLNSYAVCLQYLYTVIYIHTLQGPDVSIIKRFAIGSNIRDNQTAGP